MRENDMNKKPMLMTRIKNEEKTKTDKGTVDDDYLGVGGDNNDADNKINKTSTPPHFNAPFLTSLPSCSTSTLPPLNNEASIIYHC